METEDNQTILYQGGDRDGDAIQIVGYHNGDLVLRVRNGEERSSYGVALDKEMMRGISDTLIATLRLLEILEPILKARDLKEETKL